MHSIKRFLIIVIVVVVVSSCRNKPAKNDHITFETTSTPAINFSITQSFSHDTSLFTEGFLFYEGKLFESTGSLPGSSQKSLIGVDDLNTGKFDTKIELDKTKYFGEGISFLNNKLYQLTYTTQVCFKYDAKSFKLLDSCKYANAQGWSLTSHNNEFIMSDGTNNLTFVNPENFKPVKTLSVTEDDTLLNNLNELEYINGFIYANIYETNFIVKIDTTTGNVIGRIDLTSLVMEAQNKNPNADVANGIAYDSATDKIYVTGKLWPNIYEINFSH